MRYLGDLLLVSIPAAITGGAAIAVFVLQQRRTRDHVDESRNDIVAALMAGQVDQDQRHARTEEHMGKVLTRLGRIEARQKSDHERLRALEEEAA